MLSFRISLPVIFAAFAIAGCAAEKQPEFPTTNPLEKACQAEGVRAGTAMTDCMRRKASQGIAGDTCSRKGVRPGSPQRERCVKLEAEYSQASSECQAQGLGTFGPEEVAKFKACITGKAPEAAAYKFAEDK